MSDKVSAPHWMIRAFDRWQELRKKSCCATYHFNLIAGITWILREEKCPWCGTKKGGER